MSIQELLNKSNITKYKLSKKSNIPYSTISDIINDKVKIENCSGKNLYKIAKALNVTMESLVEERIALTCSDEYRNDFEIFKSNVCHRLKELGDISLIIEILETNQIQIYYEKKWYAESLYLLAMLDYLSRENNIALCTNYDYLRKCKLSSIIYPTGVIIESEVTNNLQLKINSFKNAIPEFKKFNIVENEVRNVI